jgi:5'-nucleotidase
MKKVVLCDLDGISADFLTELLGRYNNDHKQYLTVENITRPELHENIDIGERIYDYIRKPGFYSVLRPIDGAIEALEELNKLCTLVVLSTPSQAAESATEKILWCKKYLPFIHRRHLMFGAMKELVYGDFFIDDMVPNLEKWKARHQDGYTITIDYPNNRHIQANFRAFGYKDTRGAWDGIKHFITSRL